MVPAIPTTSPTSQPSRYAKYHKNTVYQYLPLILIVFVCTVVAFLLPYLISRVSPLRLRERKCTLDHNKFEVKCSKYWCEVHTNVVVYGSGRTLRMPLCPVCQQSENSTMAERCYRSYLKTMDDGGIGFSCAEIKRRMWLVLTQPTCYSSTSDLKAQFRSELIVASVLSSMFVLASVVLGPILLYVHRNSFTLVGPPDVMEMNSIIVGTPPAAKNTNRFLFRAIQMYPKSAAWNEEFTLEYERDMESSIDVSFYDPKFMELMSTSATCSKETILWMFRPQMSKLWTCLNIALTCLALLFVLIISIVVSQILNSRYLLVAFSLFALSIAGWQTVVYSANLIIKNNSRTLIITSNRVAEYHKTILGSELQYYTLNEISGIEYNEKKKEVAFLVQTNDSEMSSVIESHFPHKSFKFDNLSSTHRIIETIQNAILKSQAISHS